MTGQHDCPTITRLHKGDTVKFAGERRRYRVMAANERFAVCTKPFAAIGTTIYTIVDFVRQIRGRENLIFCMGFETELDCEQALARLVDGESEVSYRHWAPLEIVDVEHVQ